MTDTTTATEVTASPLLARALDDMRQDRRVLILTLTQSGAVTLLRQATEHLDTANGERAHHGSPNPRIATRGRGMIAFARYSGPGRGIDLDSVYVDHSELEQHVLPMLIASHAPRFEASTSWSPPAEQQPTDGETVPARHTVTQAQLGNALDALGLGSHRVTELHLDRRGGHAITLRTDAAGVSVIVDDSLVHDVLFVDVVEGSSVSVTRA